jgi:hypothetical protein
MEEEVQVSATEAYQQGTKPHEFIGFGAMDVTKPYEFIGFGAMDVTRNRPKI